MKKILATISLVISLTTINAQQEKFDITTYTSLKGWKKHATEQALQLTHEDAAKGTYCMITLYKALPGSDDARTNFDLSWENLVKESLSVAAAPEMQTPATEDGWQVQSGYATFEKDDLKGMALLANSTGFGKMINILILTNSNTYEPKITSFLESISFRKPAAAPATNKKPVTGQPVATTAIKTKFAFNTTNFDDGWVATEQADWVEVTKGNLKVLLHYPNKKADEYNPVLLDGLKIAWDILVAPRYKSASGMQFKPVSGWESIEYAEATMVDSKTNKTVYVVLFKKNYSGGSGRFMEFIAPDKSTFEKAFGVYRQESFGWETMEKMINYNKFAIAASDLTGKWTNNFSGIQQYVNARTGADAGMDTHSSVQTFQFTGAAYKWELTVASGFVGAIKFNNVKSNGKFSVPNNWQVYFSDIEKKPRTYDAQFTCIKGARILWIDGIGYAKAE
jgi:hypothetical protein